MLDGAGTQANIKGGVLLSRLAYVRKKGGEAALQQVLARLGPKDREILQGILLPVSWYPLELNVRLDDAIASVLSPEDRRRAFVEMGRASAEEALKSFHSMFVKAGDPHALLSQAPAIYKRYYAVGRRTYEKTGERAATLRTYDAEAVTQTDCITVCGWHERAVELCGGKDVRVIETGCRSRGQPHCEYHVSWK